MYSLKGRLELTFAYLKLLSLNHKSNGVWKISQNHPLSEPLLFLRFNSFYVVVVKFNLRFNCSAFLALTHTQFVLASLYSTDRTGSLILGLGFVFFCWNNKK